ncbi:MAG: CSLREA domain-containing protein [Acidimicrobiia bacterium]|nr:CSLREA domain-containing protein [Acidimicrobiia bacterium]MCC5954390.1 CSLREA domain-containing protein [Acidimicrobiia bacterium]
MSAAVGVGLLLSACEPGEPPPLFEVTTFADAAAAAPGDGVCEATAGEGDCTLRAAIEESNTVDRAQVAAPAGVYDWDLGTMVVTSNVQINWGAHSDPATFAAIDAAWSSTAVLRVEEGGVLAAEGLGVPGTLEVEGTAVLRRGVFVNPNAPVVRVGAEGAFVAELSYMATLGQPVRNEGTVHLVASTLRGITLWGAQQGPVVRTQGDGTTTFASSVLRGFCEGTAPTSLGYSVGTSDTCGLDGPGDAVGAIPHDGHFVEIIDIHLWYEIPLPTTLIRHRVPEGLHSCGGQRTTDLRGAPRPVGSGCDSGAIEFQSSDAPPWDGW